MPQHKCEDCKWWVKDYGIMTITGWTGMDKDDGWCRANITEVRKNGKSFCRGCRAAPRRRAKAANHCWEARHER